MCRDGSVGPGFECSFCCLLAVWDVDNSNVVLDKSCGDFQTSPSCFWKQVFLSTFWGPLLRDWPWGQWVVMSDLPLGPIVDEFLYSELKMATSALWVGWG